MEHISPKKSLGQNFLTDVNIAAKIVRQFGARPGETVVEIGPGEGALTRLLVADGVRPVAVELDPRAAERVQATFGDAVEVIQADVLKTDLTAIARRSEGGRIRVLGNIPYYITSPILFHLIEHRAVVSDAMLMMQREVADRLVARTRTKEYGVLSVMTQTYAEARRLFDVGPRCFFPPPKVTSSIVTFNFRDLDGIANLEATHRTLVRAAFNQRRKTLRNSLAQLLPTQEERELVFTEAGINPGARAEELAPADFIRLAGVFAQTRASGQRQP